LVGEGKRTKKMSTDEKKREQTAEQAAESETSVVQERLNWRLAQRDDTRVAQGLYAGEEIEEMHELSDAGLLDEFFAFLEEVEMMQVFEEVVLPDVKRMLVPTIQFILLYLRHPCSLAVSRCMSFRVCFLVTWG
jgi:hypothetical protein